MFSLKWVLIWVKISKCYCYQIAAKRFQICPEFCSQWTSQNYVRDVWRFEFPFLIFFSSKNFKFTIVSYGEIKLQFLARTVTLLGTLFHKNWTCISLTVHFVSLIVLVEFPEYLPLSPILRNMFQFRHILFGEDVPGSSACLSFDFRICSIALDLVSFLGSFTR